MIQYYLVDAFTDQIGKGNQAGVVLNSENLSPAAMQQIAKEINVAETAFLSHENNEEVIYFYTPTTRIAFCGHAMLSLAWVLSENGKYPRHFWTDAGPVEADYGENIMILQAEPHFRWCPETRDFTPEYLFGILGINMNEYENQYPIVMGSTGNWDLLIPVKTVRGVDRARPDMAALARHNERNGLTGVHLYAFTGTNPAILYTRNFAPAVGIPEDPVTGSSNGALSVYLYREHLIHQTEFDIIQSNSYNRPGRLKIRIRPDGRVETGGKAVIERTGFIRL